MDYADRSGGQQTGRDGSGAGDGSFGHALGRVFLGGSPSRLHGPRFAGDEGARVLGSVDALAQLYGPDDPERNRGAARHTHYTRFWIVQSAWRISPRW